MDIKEKNYGIICDIGGKGKGNQDSAFHCEFDMIIAPGSPESKSFSQKCILSIVCDGVSASSHGEKGSSFVIRKLSSKIISYLITVENFQVQNVQNKINQFIKETNLNLIEKYKNFIDSGKIPQTTIVGTLIIANFMWIFNIGDSKLYLLKDNLMKQISIDDVGTGAVHEITQAFGQTPINIHSFIFNWAFEDKINFGKPVFKKNYYVLLCSDGLSDVINANEIKEILLKNNEEHNLEDIVENLYILSMERKTEDNVSIIAIDLANYFKSLSPISIIKLEQ